MSTRELPDGWVLGTEHTLYAIGLGEERLPRRSLSNGRRLFRVCRRADRRPLQRPVADDPVIDLWRGGDTNPRTGTVRFSRADFSSTLVTLRREEGTA